MRAEKLRPTLADYVTIVISPALIMAMIVSLVFFLLTVCYRGQYAARLHTILFFFTFGMVLVARIAMAGASSDRAPLYGCVLAVAVWVGMGKFVDYPPELAASSWLINALLVTLAWWLSYQLTYSCTHIDEKAESTGTGVLQAAGLEKALAEPPSEQKAQSSDGTPGKKRPPPTWRERYRLFREARKKTQPPGVWVVYFAVAALPIFGLGQVLIDTADTERRSTTVWLMTVYLASSLGLLVTTAFLGLRRYLRQRKLEMPKTVTAAWLTLGTLLVVAFIALGAVMPRPTAGFSLGTLARNDGEESAASKVALGEGDKGKGKGRISGQERAPDGTPASSKDGPSKKGGKGQARGTTSKEARNKSGEETRKDSEAKSGQENAQKTEPQANSNNESSPPSETKSMQWLSRTLAGLKWLVFGVLALVTVVFVLGGGLKYVANFWDWARRLLEALQRLWQGLWGGVPRDAIMQSGSTDAHGPTLVPFHAFANPFQDGRAETMTPAELVRYSFEALAAWSEKHGCGRGSHETPMEFTERVAEEVAALANETKHLGELAACVFYGPGRLSGTWRATLDGFWRRLESLPRDLKLLDESPVLVEDRVEASKHDADR